MGAEAVGGAASFRVWAPGHARVAVAVDGCGDFELQAEGDGYFSGMRAATPVGTLYRLRLDDAKLVPDAASRFQPQGHLGPSALVDPHAYRWRDAAWRGLEREGQVLYEMHVGTFTREGTWRAATRELPALADLGITALELMPVGEFPGEFGWGYDVVHYYAPTRLYGTPEDMRAFVDEAHRLGMGVILDVVYNHCAAIGCFLPDYTPKYFSRRHKNDWGHSLNFDGEGAGAVREFFLANVDYWVSEFHLDGFRFDATQSIVDDSPTHILAQMAERSRTAARGRGIYLVGENEPQDVNLLRDAHDGGHGLDALWNDDFHHSARVAVTGRTEAYYLDYRGRPQEFVSAAKRGFLYQGQHYAWQKQNRGSPTRGLDAARFVTFLQNHDQVANSARGLRLAALTSPGRLRAATALLLLAPQTPMLFQGQEFAASAPFLYFADNAPADARMVRTGRGEFLRQFQSTAAEGHVLLADPAVRETFERCKLDLAERAAHAEVYALHRDLIALRKSDAVFSAAARLEIDGAVLASEAFALRYFGGETGDRLIIVNFGAELALSPVPEPLLAPPPGAAWSLLWSSEAVAYGGDGTPPPECAAVWRVPAHGALAFAAHR
ncbi:MAG TPA: malto-oligosyltrehalose trehalohydrolase [Burkholderiales bacterium]|nr:malto-oligosyltrehalose trehalohydrolase [Burkholderiales bacterium]